MSNIYPTRPGFGLRVNRARKALENFGRDCMAAPYSRAFDNYFENHDGDAVVWALMHDAIHGNTDLEQGIRALGGRNFANWMNIYDPSTKQRIQLRLAFLDDQQNPVSN